MDGLIQSLAGRANECVVSKLRIVRPQACLAATSDQPMLASNPTAERRLQRRSLVKGNLKKLRNKFRDDKRMTDRALSPGPLWTLPPLDRVAGEKGRMI